MTLWITGPVLFLASLNTVAISQELFPPHTCCPQKYLPESGNYTFYQVSPDLRERYGCLDDCMYVKDGTDEKYCFAPGPFKVICEEYFCGPPECNIVCQEGEECIENPEIVCVTEPCCERWSCEPGIISYGYATIKEDGTIFNQTYEDTPDYFKMTVPAHNNYTDAVVFYDKKTGYRVSCTQGRDTAAPFTWTDTRETMRIIKANEGKIIDRSTEMRTYYVEYVTDETIPDDERPVEIAPDTPIYRSTIRRVTEEDYTTQLPQAMDIPICVDIPSTHDLTIRMEDIDLK